MNKGHANPRYKTALCKKYMQSQSCPYGDKCQFAHGEQELRSFNGHQQNMMYAIGMGSKNQNNMLNYKIVKCKNWEKDKSCKYGAHCTYAHGEEELRNKADNLYQMNTNVQMMVPMMLPPGMDMNQMQQIMLSNQLMMGMGMNPAMPNQNLNQNNPNATQGKNEMQTDEK